LKNKTEFKDSVLKMNSLLEWVIVWFVNS
jgi:hypothetical protein